ncbi:unnamed protein product [Nezara viridula]|uniref:Uncharacterized protein n=1 Tax=Nezara viridula TaxID=85310 RepID=A0A9P0HSZ5_NEZVI|nr:unnamed protein product [Nezara viridula]
MHIVRISFVANSGKTRRRRCRTDGILNGDKGQSISHDMKARRLKWAGHVAHSNPSGRLYTTTNARVVGKRPHAGAKNHMDR